MIATAAYEKMVNMTPDECDKAIAIASRCLLPLGWGHGLVSPEDVVLLQRFVMHLLRGKEPSEQANEIGVPNAPVQPIPKSAWAEYGVSIMNKLAELHKQHNEQQKKAIAVEERKQLTEEERNRMNKVLKEYYKKSYGIANFSCFDQETQQKPVTFSPDGASTALPMKPKELPPNPFADYMERPDDYVEPSPVAQKLIREMEARITTVPIPADGIGVNYSNANLMRKMFGFSDPKPEDAIRTEPEPVLVSVGFETTCWGELKMISIDEIKLPERAAEEPVEPLTLPAPKE